MRCAGGQNGAGVEVGEDVGGGGDGGGRGGPMFPQAPSAAPPTGSAGQGSGDGEDVSSLAAGGGGACWPGHPTAGAAACDTEGERPGIASPTSSATTTPTTLTW